MKARYLIIPAAALGVLTASRECYRIIFKRRGKNHKTRRLDGGAALDAFGSDIEEGLRFIDGRPFEQIYISSSSDGIRLAGKYYPADNEQTLMILFHGYRSTARGDFSCIYETFLNAGRSILLVDQRAHGMSGGNAVTFGVLESRDCLDWANYADRRFGKKLPIFIEGISMGASTVMMASDLPLPASVAGIIADCGYTSPEEIIRNRVRYKRLPDHLIWPFARLGAVIFGGFDPSSRSAEKALSRCSLPLLLIHGEGDTIVPCDMSRRNCAACAGETTLVTVPAAGHGLAYPTDRETVGSALAVFVEKYSKKQN
ncbi:MAG: hypothetical protein EOM54_05920 [Clostridia bacterium]|nr:hypothetical protein [Clostridia bacterium]NCC68482.1 hypothetical protein [Clostridia bacterium]